MLVKYLSFVFLLLCLSGKTLSGTITDSSFTETAVTLNTPTGDIYGTLTTPRLSSFVPVALIISGSGPTDRNGNNSMMKNDGLKQLAFALGEAGIASLRFDKRGIAASTAAAKSEADLRFEDYVNDAKSWIDLLKKDKRFSKIIVIGHSEGSLIGLIAANNNADKFVSIAGAGRAADLILKEQLNSQPDEIKNTCYAIIDSLKAGKTVVDVDPTLGALFRLSVQPYVISWFKYDPRAEIKKLSIPVLILQGKNDLQVTEEDAKQLATASPAARLVLIPDMNHVLKIVTGDKNENMKAYNDPSLALSAILTKEIIDFIKAK